MNILMKILLMPSAICWILAGVLSASEPAGSDSGNETRALTVQEAVRMAVSRAPEVLIAEAQAIRSTEALRESRSLNRPQVYAGTGLAYNNGFPLSIEGSAPSIFQVNASQPFLSKRNANLTREAAESEKAGRFGIESARNELASRTASVYYELHQARQILALASARAEAAQTQQQQVEILLEAGRVLPAEAAQMRTAVLSARHQLLVAREQALIADKELHELTGLSDAVEIRTVEPKVDSPALELQEEALYQLALQSAPSILQAEAEVRAKDFHIEAERGDYLPKMEIVGQYALLSRANNYADYFSRFARHNYLFGLSIQMPVFNGSGTSARVAQSRQAASEARLNLQRVKSDLKLEIQRGLSALRIARGAVDLARSDAETAREMVRVHEILMEGGRITAKELEDSRTQLLQKELALLDADQNLYQRKIDLLYTTGSITAAIQ
ncbi:MAG: TolC family protein [Acidobacteriota bacterium]|nr:TolC family protein [Acidobacteriota bacterium]